MKQPGLYWLDPEFTQKDQKTWCSNGKATARKYGGMVQTRLDPEKGCLKHKQQPKHGIRPFVFEVAPAEGDVYDLISVDRTRCFFHLVVSNWVCIFIEIGKMIYVDFHFLGIGWMFQPPALMFYDIKLYIF